MIRILSLVLVFSTAAAIASAQGSRGEQIFTAQKCYVCHSVAGQGNKKGPLDGVGAMLKAEEIREWILNAPAMAAKAKAERKPAMKAFSALPKDDVDALVEYLVTLKKK